MFLKQEKRENGLEGSVFVVSLKAKRTRRKLKKQKAAAHQMGSSGEKEVLIVESESLPPTKAPRTKERPAKAEK